MRTSAQRTFQYPGDWVEEAQCREEPNKFYPPDDKPVPRNFYSIAKRVCADCPVRLACLKYGLDEVYGVWGMTTPVERGMMREKRAIAQRLKIKNGKAR